MAAWCMVATCGAAAARRAGAVAAAEAGGGNAEHGMAHVAAGAIGMAAAAIGAVWVSDDGEPCVRMGNADEDSGAHAVTVQYAQMQRAQQLGVDADVASWGGEAGEWLREQHAGAPDATWTAYTRRQFRRGGGAAKRKEAVGVAVRGDGAVYDMAPVAAWPWRLTYAMHVCTTAQDAADAQWIKVEVRLGQGVDSGVAAMVSAVGARRDGSTVPRATWERTAVRLQEGERDGGLEALFWPFAWRGARWPSGGMRRALDYAASAAAAQHEDVSGGWEALRSALGGEVPRLTVSERMEERRQREEVQADENTDAS